MLEAGGVVLLYGPFKQGQKNTAPSNIAFDLQLKAQNIQWGVRELEAVLTVATDTGFECREVIAMPANNLAVIFSREKLSSPS